MSWRGQTILSQNREAILTGLAPGIFHWGAGSSNGGLKYRFHGTFGNVSQ